MERIIRPYELTGQGGSAYSNSMPENTGENTTQASPDYQAPRTPEQVEAGVQDWERYLRNQGQAVDANARQTLQIMSQAGYVPPDNPNAEQRLPRTQPEQTNQTENVDYSGALDQMGEAVQRGVEAAFSGRDKKSAEEKIDVINPDEFIDPELKKIAGDIVYLTNTGSIFRDVPLLDEMLTRVQARKIHPASVAEAERLKERLNQIKGLTGEYKKSIQAGTEHTLSLQLTEEDFKRLRNDPRAWLNEQLDWVYRISKQGRELDSRQLTEIQGRQVHASNYLSKLPDMSPEFVGEFDREFLTKLSVLYARASVQQRNLEGITGLSTQLGTHGILDVLSYEKGMVGMMHNRIQELYDDVRIRSRQHHITAEESSKIQNKVINEFSSIIEKDDEMVARIIGDMPISKANRREVVRAAVTRSVRTGYDHFVASQREAVITARGEALMTSNDLEGIIADPGGLFSAFNYEQMLIAKFGLLNEDQEKFFSALKRKYAESELSSKKTNIGAWAKKRIEQNPELAKKAAEDGISEKEQALIDYGEDLMKDLMFVNDFYSSGWRVEAFLKQIDEMFMYKKAEELFERQNKDEFDRLRKILDSNDNSTSFYRKKTEAQEEYSREVGKRLESLSTEEMKSELDDAKAKASEFGLFLRLRDLTHGKVTEKNATEVKEVWQTISKYRPEDVVKIFREHGTAKELEGVNRAFAKMGIRPVGDMTYYDQFKEEYGAAIRLVREKGFNLGFSPEQIDFSEINSPNYAKYKEDLVNALTNESTSREEAIEKVNKLEELFKEMKKFAGDKDTIKTLMEDIRFRDVYQRTRETDDMLLFMMEDADQRVGLTQVSEKLDSDPGGAAFRRTYNDMANAQKAHEAFLVFLRSDDPQEKMKAALEAGEAASHYAGPDARAKIFRQLYGNYMLMGTVAPKDANLAHHIYEALGMRQKPLRMPINELQEIFGPAAPAFNNDEMLKFLDEHSSDLTGRGIGTALLDEMRELANTRPQDRVKFALLRALLFGMLWVSYEAVHDTEKVFEEGFKSN